MSGDLARWLQAQIEGDKALAEVLVSGALVSPVWREMSSGVLDVGDHDPADHWAGVWAAGDSRLTRFIASHDPRAIIADCEAKLAILEYAEATSERYGRESVPARIALQCVAVLGSGYQHRPGYREEWRP